MLVLLPGGRAAAGGCETVDALEAFPAMDRLPEGAVCNAFLGQSGKSGVSCHWAFPFRDTGAEVFAAGLWSDLQDCRAGQEGGPDQRVNHPDSFELREWLAEGAIYRLSIKDKGGLNKTLVFFSHEAQ